MIRAATSNDLDQLTELFHGYRAFYGKPRQDKAGEFLQSRLRERDSEIFVSDVNGILTGFVQLYPLFSSTRLARYWLLNDLFVHADHRGSGYSKALIERAKKLCRDTDACGMYLETGKDNDIGNSLYPSAGFELLDEVNFYEWATT